jgi:hypothetical protein
VLFCHVTTHIKGRAHDDLLQQMGGRGWPSFFILDGEGKKWGTVNLTAFPPEGIGDFTAALDAAVKAKADVAELSAKAAKGEEGAKLELLRKELELGHLTHAAAQERVRSLGELDPETTKDLAGRLAAVEFSELEVTVKDQESLAAASKEIYAMAKAGRIPSGRDAAVGFWQAVLSYGSANSDPEAFELALKKMEELLSGDPRWKAFHDRMSQRLEELKAGAGKQEAGQEPAKEAGKDK